MDAGIEVLVEKAGQTTRHARVRIEEAIVLDHPDEQAEPFVELVQQEPVEPDVVVQEPLESLARDVGDPAPAQSDGVEPPHPVFQYRPFAKPAARGHARERGRLPRLRSRAQLHQSFDDAHPGFYRFAGATNVPVDGYRAV